MYPLLLAFIFLPSIVAAHFIHSSQQLVLPTPEIPPLRSVRLATLKDIRRIGLVATASFYHSPFFHYQRPDYREFPFDTVASYRAEFAKAILGNDSIVIVVEDVPEKDEIDHVYGELKKVYRSEPQPESSNSSKIIVGVCSLKLPANSTRSGQFVPRGSNTSIPEPDPQDMKRDQSSLANKLLGDALAIPEGELFNGRMVVDMVAVHPSYWNKGHGTKLVEWMNELADINQEGLAVAAAKTGVGLFQHVGYRQKELVEIKGYDRHPKSIFSWFGHREPCRTGPNAWRYITPTVPIPSVQPIFTHQLNVVVAGLRVACHSPARTFVSLSCTRTIQLGRTS